MDSTGRIHMYEDTAPTAAPSAERFRHTGFVTKDPMPEACDARKVLTALDKLGARPVTDPPPAMSDAALLPLTPFERGYVLGTLAAYRAWKADQ